MPDSLKVIGREIYLQKPCEIVSFGNEFKIWMWNKLALRKELVNASDGVNIFERAIEINENYIIKKDEFDLSEGIVVK
jgi:hypothetical protein